MKIVFDTNIYLAATMSADFCYELMQNALSVNSGITLYTSEPILTELKNKFLEFQKAGRISSDRIAWMLSSVKKSVMKVFSTERISVIKVDPDDNKILECAVAADADLIVTMDKHLLKLKVFRRIAIVHPKTFSFMLPKI